MATPNNADKESTKAQEVWQRYESARQRGHTSYQRQARRNEDIYLGGGLQWSAEDRQILEDEGRPAYEVNVAKVAVDSAVGYQINNRMDISFAPRGGDADDKTAEILSRVVMQVADQIDLHWTETQVFTDGMIQQRGYYDVRLDFDDNMMGQIAVTDLDPMDVVPDPDAKGYDPDRWAYVLVTRWLTLDEIEETYGSGARTKLERSGQDAQGSEDWGEHDIDDMPRSKFGNEQGVVSDHILDRPDDTAFRVRLIEQQRWVYTMTRVLVTAEGDVIDAEEMTPDERAAATAEGAILTKRMKRRVRWTVTAANCVLHDDWSPFPWFTVVPYFPYFRRGQTRGMIDNATGPQEIINKAISQYIHVLNSNANGGWTVEEGSLKNMSTDDLRAHGSATGLVIEYKQGRAAPDKIQPNQVPTGIDRIIERAFDAFKEVTVPDAMRGMDGNQQDSGIAIQSKQFAAQQQLAVALDNLARTRHMLARRALYLAQHFYSEERVFRITETRPDTGRDASFDLRVNVTDPFTGNVINDLTMGLYDVVVTEQPMQVTFSNTQFDQALRMREMGVPIPDSVMVRTSMLTDKAEILEEMKRQSEAQRDPVSEADAKRKLAQAAKAEADEAKARAEAKRIAGQSVNDKVETQYSAIQTAQTIAQIPATAPLADSILRSAGFEDANAAPAVPSYGGPAASSVPDDFVPSMPPAADAQAQIEAADASGDGVVNGGDIAGVPENTHPMTPANPQRGIGDGIDGGS